MGKYFSEGGSRGLPFYTNGSTHDLIHLTVNTGGYRERPKSLMPLPRGQTCNHNIPCITIYSTRTTVNRGGIWVGGRGRCTGLMGYHVTIYDIIHMGNRVGGRGRCTGLRPVGIWTNLIFVNLLVSR